MIQGFKEGMKVVCVDETFSTFVQLNIPFLPKKDKIYTVREVQNVTHLSLLLEEIVNPKMLFKAGYLEPSFMLYHFKPLDQYNKELTEEIVSRVQKQIEQEQPLEVIENSFGRGHRKQFVWAFIGHNNIGRSTSK